MPYYCVDFELSGHIEVEAEDRDEAIEFVEELGTDELKPYIQNGSAGKHYSDEIDKPFDLYKEPTGLQLKRGTLVEALKDLDPEGANVKKGDKGVVFEELNAYGDGGGPMVAWFKADGGNGFCNVYEGDVKVV